MSNNTNKSPNAAPSSSFAKIEGGRNNLPLVTERVDKLLPPLQVVADYLFLSKTRNDTNKSAAAGLSIRCADLTDGSGGTGSTLDWFEAILLVVTTRFVITDSAPLPVNASKKTDRRFPGVIFPKA